MSVLEKSVLEEKFSLFSKEFRQKCEKSFLESVDMFSSEDIDYLLSLNEEKDLSYTLNNLTLKEAKKLSDKVFKVVITDKAGFDEINEMIDNPDKSAANYFVISLQLGAVIVELQFDNLTDNVLSEYSYYIKKYNSKTNEYFWDYRDYVGTSVNPLKLYKDLVKFFEDNDERHLNKYFEQMFDIIEKSYYWYVPEIDIKSPYKDYLRYIQTLGNKELAVRYYKNMMDSLL